MPRAPSSKRQNGAANGRDTRHEGGLVGPGKRVVKQKSKTELQDNNGNGSPSTAEQPPALPALPPLLFKEESNGSSDTILPARRQGADSALSLSEAQDASTRPTGDAATPQSSASTEQPTAYQDGFRTTDAKMTGHRTIDLNALNDTSVHRDTGLRDVKPSIIRSFPLLDTIALLVILMQLPSAGLSMVYILFTALTFTPQVATTSGFILTELLEGPATPNIWTLVVLDVFAAVLFAFLPFQDIIVDFAQVVVSMTLGGGAASRTRASRNIAACIAVLSLSHFPRYAVLDKLSRLRSYMVSGSTAARGAASVTISSTPTLEKKSAIGLINSLLAVHIIMQGLARYVKAWYIRRERRDALPQAHNDSDSSKAGPPNIDSNSSDQVGTELEASSLLALRRQKKRQSAKVRMEQPLWAALASTKIFLLSDRLQESSKSFNMSAAPAWLSWKSKPMPIDAHDAGRKGDEQFWIAYVGSDEICFETSFFEDDLEYHTEPDNTTESNEISRGPMVSKKGKGRTIRTAVPFFVRVNNAVWQPTRITAVKRDDAESLPRRSQAVDQTVSDSPNSAQPEVAHDAMNALEREGDRPEAQRWTGDIYGLMPMSIYRCEFVSKRTGKVLYETSVRTIPEKAIKCVPTPGLSYDDYRQDTAANLLRTALAAEEVKLEEARTKQKAMRKEHSRKVNALKKDIEKISMAIQSSGGQDEKLRQKIAQNITQTKQAEQSIIELDAKLRELGDIPESTMREYRQAEKAFKAEEARHEAILAAHKASKAAWDKKISTIEEECQALQLKKAKMQARLDKAESERLRILDANARGLGETERRNQIRANHVQEMGAFEQDMQEKLSRMQAEMNDKRTLATNLEAALQTYWTGYQSNHTAYEDPSRPQDSPYGANQSSQNMWPQYADNVWSPASSNATAAMMNPASTSNTTTNYGHQQQQLRQQQHMPEFQPSGLSYQLPLQPLPERRGRSSSMLSDISGLTESSEGDTSQSRPSSVYLNQVNSSQVNAYADHNSNSNSNHSHTHNNSLSYPNPWASPSSASATSSLLSRRNNPHQTHTPFQSSLSSQTASIRHPPGFGPGLGSGPSSSSAAQAPLSPFQYHQHHHQHHASSSSHTQINHQSSNPLSPGRNRDPRPGSGSSSRQPSIGGHSSRSGSGGSSDDVESGRSGSGSGSGSGDASANGSGTGTGSGGSAAEGAGTNGIW